MYAIVNENPTPFTEVPKQIGEINATCLAIDADERYQSADELLTDLRQCRDVSSGSEPVEIVMTFRMPCVCGKCF